MSISFLEALREAVDPRLLLRCWEQSSYDGDRNEDNLYRESPSARIMNALPLETASEAIPTSTTSPKYHIAVKVEEEATTAIQNVFDADTEVDDEVPKE